MPKVRVAPRRQEAIEQSGLHGSGRTERHVNANKLVQQEPCIALVVVSEDGQWCGVALASKPPSLPTGRALVRGGGGGGRAGPAGGR